MPGQRLGPSVGRLAGAKRVYAGFGANENPALAELSHVNRRPIRASGIVGTGAGNVKLKILHNRFSGTKH